MFEQFTGVTIIGLFLSGASLYGPGAFPDAIYISNLDDLDAKISRLWRRLGIGCVLFSASMLAILVVGPISALADQFSQSVASLERIDAVIFLGVLFTWILTFLVSCLCFVLESFRRKSEEKVRLEGIPKRNG